MFALAAVTLCGYSSVLPMCSNIYVPHVHLRRHTQQNFAAGEALEWGYQILVHTGSLLVPIVSPNPHPPSFKYGMTLVPGLPPFFGLQYTSGREVKNREHLGTLNIVMCSGRKRWVGGGGRVVHNYKSVNWSIHDCLGSCLATEHSTMKSSMIFECGPLPPLHPHRVHLTSFTS